MYRNLAAAILFWAGTMSPNAYAVVLGQVDTFSGDLEGWFAGGGPGGGVPSVPPSVVPNGGPGGTGDPYLVVTALGGFSAGGRLVAMNAGQWAGDYTAAGVTAVEMDLRNLGATDLEVRLYLEDPIPGPPQNEAVTNVSFLLPAGGAWTHVLFPLTAGDLATQNGDPVTLLGNTTILRIFHSTSPAFPGEPVAGILGVDNIRAVPEPATLALMLAGLAGLAGVAAQRRAR
jgi:PEP-CTERM motif